jgi:hypothetical protein
MVADVRVVVRWKTSEECLVGEVQAEAREPGIPLVSGPAVGRTFRAFPNPDDTRFHSLSRQALIRRSRQALRRPEHDTSSS